jgi:hypothetical protein
MPAKKPPMLFSPLGIKKVLASYLSRKNKNLVIIGLPLPLFH